MAIADLLEQFLGGWVTLVLVRMESQRKSPVGGLDFVCLGMWSDSKCLVKAFACWSTHDVRFEGWSMREGVVMAVLDELWMTPKTRRVP